MSHLMFADDLLLFGEASETQAQIVIDCLDKFCKASGERVNRSKSSLFFSKNIPPDLKGRIKRIMGIKISAEIGHYLGFPLSMERKSMNKFQYIVNKVKSKLAAWKSNCLTTVERVTLAKSVLSSIPLYPMQVAKVLIAICHEIEKL